MRSDLVFVAMKQVPHRYLLAAALAKATRGLHKPGTRIEDTTNDVLTRFGRAGPIAQGDTVPPAASTSPHHSRSLVTIRRPFKIRMFRPFSKFHILYLRRYSYQATRQWGR